MVRLIGLISEKQIQPTHTKILVHGTHASAAATEQGATLAINTGLRSVKKGIAWYKMKANIATALHAALPEGAATVGPTFYVGALNTVGGNVTIDWFAIGD